MAVIMKNYADKMGYSIPKTLEAVTFADNAQISSWAKDAVKAMQQAGVLSGKENNRFDPAGQRHPRRGGYCPAPVCGDCH